MKTVGICREQNELVEHGVIESVIDKNILMVRELLSKCDELEQQYDQLDAIGDIAVSFKNRLKQIITQYKKYICLLYTSRCV